ncbi:hypothetical protein [Paenibacillus lentus]|uniref:Uncharacterized protein n=1 Tax=Paenibacillus lentus TaxID=1338368 RepID=A0A3Q8S4U1_9BACL|nr:hypothetical protein [Paenibacillus lentus]AZK46638.1 hypothetical protein EIM92_11150 [Paenibacillus lentus]
MVKQVKWRKKENTGSEKIEAWLALGGDRLPLIFDFNQWLKGGNENIKRIKGELETNLPFVNV